MPGTPISRSRNPIKSKYYMYGLELESADSAKYLKSVSSLCTRGKSSIAPKLASVHPKNFKW